MNYFNDLDPFWIFLASISYGMFRYLRAIYIGHVSIELAKNQIKGEEQMARIEAEKAIELARIDSNTKIELAKQTQRNIVDSDQAA